MKKALLYYPAARGTGSRFPPDVSGLGQHRLASLRDHHRRMGCSACLADCGTEEK